MSDDVQRIKDKIDVVDLISEYIQLKVAGSNHKGLCPFHNEKSPSFMVNRERQNWHCFGCNKGGDIFTFVQDIEGMDFREALKYLAEKAGIQLSNTFKSDVESSQKNRIKDINQDAARFYHNVLIKMSVSKDAMDYLKNRGLTDDTIQEWQIGFIPEQWDLLTKYLLKKGHSIDDLVASGLTIKRDPSKYSGQISTDTKNLRGFYDRFRGRIMFPIWDVHDNVVGFTGRILVETDRSGGKYVNTPQTPVYDKSRVVFGLNKAKREIKQKDKIVMCEGQMDVIACHQAGMKNVVASSGTALTHEQVKLLKRYSNNMNMAFDSDEAGEKAAKRGIDIAIAEGMNVKVIQIPDGAGKDPDEVLQKNKQIWFDAVEHALDVMKWYFVRAFKHRDLSNPKDKQAIASALLPEIKRIPFAIERDYWVQELSGQLQVDVSILREDMKRISADQKIKREFVTEKKSEVQMKKTKFDILIEQFIVLLMKSLESLPTGLFSLSQAISTSIYSSLYEALKIGYNENISVPDGTGQFNLDKIREYFATYSTEQDFNRLLMTGEKDFVDFTPEQLQDELKKLDKKINDDWIKSERRRLQTEIAAAEVMKDDEKLEILIQEFQQLQ